MKTGMKIWRQVPFNYRARYSFPTCIFYSETLLFSELTKKHKGDEMVSYCYFDGFRIDLLFPIYRLAVMYDKFGHSYRDTW